MRTSEVRRVAGRLVLLYEELQRAAPTEVREEAGATVAAYRDVVKSGDANAFQDLKRSGPKQELEDFAESSCPSRKGASPTDPQ